MSNPNQARDRNGRFTDSGAAGVHGTIHRALKTHLTARNALLGAKALAHITGLSTGDGHTDVVLRAAGKTREIARSAGISGVSGFAKIQIGDTTHKHSLRIKNI